MPRRPFIAAIALGMSLLTLELWPLLAQTPAGPFPKPSGQQQPQLGERDRLEEEALVLQAGGKYSEALALYIKKLTIERAVLGNRHEDVVATLRQLVELHAKQEDFAAARKWAKEAVDLQSQIAETKPWQITEARRTRDHIEELARLDRPGRRQLADGDQLSDQLLALYLKGQFRQGLPLAQKVVEITRQTLGDKHLDHATSLNNLGVFHHSLGAYAQAAPLYRQALDLFKAALGEEHPDFVTTLNNLAVLRGLKGDYAGALPLYRRALELRGRVVGENHPDYVRSVNNMAWLYKAMGDYAQAESLYLKALKLQQKGPHYGRGNGRILEIFRRVDVRRPPAPAMVQTDLALIVGNLAVLYQERGDYPRAEPLHRQALDLIKKTLGEEHEVYARSLNNLARAYEDMGDYAQAEALFQKAVALRKQALGEKHPDYATSLHNLGRFYLVAEDYDRAEPLFLQALAIRKEALGEKHPYYAQTLDKLARLYHLKEDYARAEPLYVQALEGRKHTLGERHRYDATIITNQARLYHAMGQLDKAQSLLRKSLEWTRKEVGEQNHEYTKTLHFLALLHFARKQYADGERLDRQALGISRTLLEHCAAVQSERQQLEMMKTTRYYLDGYLSMAERAEIPADRAYAEILAWKGTVTLRQQTMRRLRRTLEKEGKPEALKLYHDLELATRRLASLSQAGSAGQHPDKGPKELERLSAEIERLEQALAGVNDEFRRGRAKQERSPADLIRALPPRTILIDLLEYNYLTPPPSGKGRFRSERRLVAFVVRRGSPIKRIDLGPTAPLGEAVDAWRRSLVRTGQDRGSGLALRRLLWEPLAKEVQGAQAVLLSPDGAVARLPWGVLPGSKPGSHLLEEFALAVVPVPAQLPELLTSSREPVVSPSIFLLGDVNFDALPGSAKQLAQARSAPHGTRSGAALKWGPLPGTRTEIAAIKETFRKRFPKGRVTDLSKDQATEEAVRSQAPRHRHLHFATHGFFASSGKPASSGAKPNPRPFSPGLDVTGFHPGLLSGLVLAGANQPVQPERDDGILTALEVADLDLAEAELVVLSACETGLGESRDGEGLLGLQRAFQVAGARSVVAGLWKVPDRGTQVLMQRFYDNLWQKDLGQLEALREAQLWLLREGPKMPGVMRGLDFEEPQPAVDGRLPPFYWGAFVLSGDWR
jgi:CHAT domain-containing protein/Tfp pilus assembly protein PilF